MQRRDAPIDFSLSFLDLLLSGVGGVSILVVLFAAMGKEPYRPQPVVSRVLVVEVLGPSEDCLLGEEVGFHLAPAGSDGPPIADDYSAAWTTRPERKKNIEVPLGDDDLTSLELRLFLKALAPGKLPGPDAKPARDPNYALLLSQGVEYRLSWSTERHKPIIESDFLTAAGGFHRVIPLDRPGERADGHGPPPWFDADLLPRPHPPMEGFRPSRILLSSLDWDESAQAGYLLSADGPEVPNRRPPVPCRVDRLDPGDPFLRDRFAQLVHADDPTRKALGAGDYVTAGRRGVCAVLTGRGETQFYPRPARAGGDGFDRLTSYLGLRPGPNGFISLPSARLREYARRGMPADRLGDAELDRLLADAVANGPDRDRATSPVCKQDPLLWTLADMKGAR